MKEKNKKTTTKKEEDEKEEGNRKSEEKKRKKLGSPQQTDIYPHQLEDEEIDQRRSNTDWIISPSSVSAQKKKKTIGWARHLNASRTYSQNCARPCHSCRR